MLGCHQTLTVLNAIQKHQRYRKCSTAMQIPIFNVETHMSIMIREAWSDTNGGACSMSLAGIPVSRQSSFQCQ